MQTHHHVLNAEPKDSYGASISSFMRWAQERLQKEVEENNRVEAKTGTRDFILGSNDAKKQDFTDSEKVAIVNSIDKLRADGEKACNASSQFGIHTSTYYKWKRTNKK